MTESLRLFLACLATCPALAVGLTAMVFSHDEAIDFIDALQVWLVITVALAVLVLGVGGLYYVWTWAL